VQSIDAIDEGAGEAASPAIEAHWASRTVTMTPETPVSNVPPSVWVRPVKSGRGGYIVDEYYDDDAVIEVAMVELGVIFLVGSISLTGILTTCGMYFDNLNCPKLTYKNTVPKFTTPIPRTASVAASSPPGCNIGLECSSTGISKIPENRTVNIIREKVEKTAIKTTFPDLLCCTTGGCCSIKN
jgi:hypothetical protein